MNSIDPNTEARYEEEQQQTKERNSIIRLEEETLNDYIICEDMYEILRLIYTSGGKIRAIKTLRHLLIIKYGHHPDLRTCKAFIERIF